MNLEVEDIKLQDLSEAKAAGNADIVVNKDIELISHLEARAEINIGQARLTVDQLFSLKRGEVLELEESVTDYFTLLVEGKPIAKGSLVVVDDKFAFEVAEII